MGIPLPTTGYHVKLWSDGPIVNPSINHRAPGFYVEGVMCSACILTRLRRDARISEFHGDGSCLICAAIVRGTSQEGS